MNIISGLAACVINLMSRTYSPILVGIKFLDTFLNFGQGVMTFAIFGLESQYVFTPLVRWFERASSIWNDPECPYTKEGGLGNRKLHFTLVWVQIMAKKKCLISKNDAKMIGRKKEKEPKISDAMHALVAPEHVMINFCQY